MSLGSSMGFVFLYCFIFHFSHFLSVSLGTVFFPFCNLLFSWFDIPQYYHLSLSSLGDLAVCSSCPDTFLSSLSIFLSSVNFFWESLLPVYFVSDVFTFAKACSKILNQIKRVCVFFFFYFVMLSREKFLSGKVFWFWFCNFIVTFTWFIHFSIIHLV